MAKRQVTHIQGQRGESFLQLVRGVPQDKVLCVTIDVHKAYHRIMIVNGYYEIVERAFSIDILRDGLKQLCQLIDQAVTRTGARVLFIGMEPTGHYHENLARHLRQRYPHVRLVNSYAVKENRNQRMLRAEKDDDKDLCSIAELVLRNECFPYQPLTGDYLHLQNWVRFRLSKVRLRTRLMNQITGHLDRIFPGLVRPTKGSQGEQSSPFGRFWDTLAAQRLLEICPDPRRLANMSPAALVTLYHQRHWRMGQKQAEKIVAFAQQVLLPEPEVIAARLPLLQIDLELLQAVERAIANADEQIGCYLARTRGQVLTQVKGIGVLHAANYVAGIGNPLHYEHAGQTFKRSGLISGRNDSGTHQNAGAGQRITKMGDPYLRSGLIQVTRSLCLWQQELAQYNIGLRARGKHPGVAWVATARRVNGVLFALLRDQSSYDAARLRRNGGKKTAATDVS